VVGRHCLGLSLRWDIRWRGPLGRRDRHATRKDDGGGTGSFLKDGCTLYVGRQRRAGAA
jgi:hypothetical protein